MTEKQYRLNKWGTMLLKNNRPLFYWANDSDDIVDLLNKQEGRIKELKKENEELKQRIKEEMDRVIKLEQYVYTKLCPKLENYNEKVVSAIINTILGDVE